MNSFKKLWRHESKLTNLLVGITIAIFGLVSLNLLHYTKNSNKAFSDLAGDEVFLLNFTLFVFSLTLFGLINSEKMRKVDRNDSFHLSIGEYIPSKELNHEIRREFLKAGGTVQRKNNFTRDIDDAKKLLSVIKGDIYIYRNIAKQTTTYKVLVEGVEYKATSHNESMAICILFLKYVNYTFNKVEMI